jgi:hypothetical protein
MWCGIHPIRIEFDVGFFESHIQRQARVVPVFFGQAGSWVSIKRSANLLNCLELVEYEEFPTHLTAASGHSWIRVPVGEALVEANS